MTARNCSRAYIVGGGLAAISTAAYLIKDGKVPGEKITIFEELNFFGGSLDAVQNQHDRAYFMRGFRMLEEKVYQALFDLMSFIPCPDNPEKTIYDDYLQFNEEVKTYVLSRLVENGKAINAKPFKMSFKERLKLLKFLTFKEEDIENVKIEDYFAGDFFESNFWYLFSTTFSFQPWHSLEELKRYILRFIHVSPTVHTQQCIRSTRYNQFESIVLPVKTWLRKMGVNFVRNTAVSNIEFEKLDGKKHIRGFSYTQNGKDHSVDVLKDEYVFLSIGSMTADHSAGTMEKAPGTIRNLRNHSWKLWEKIAKVDKSFGRPEVFKSNVDNSKWIGFTATFNDSLFFKLIRKITKKKAGTEGPVTIKDSNWVISFGLPNQPHFKDQPEDLTVFWGYGLYPDKIGNFVKKKMSECTGREIMTELIHHLKMEDHLDKILRSANCIPCMMPYITSQFQPRKKGDRPKVVPDISDNFAFIGQFCEIPDDIVFTLDYSVRSAQIAVNSILKLDRKETPIYKGQKRPYRCFENYIDCTPVTTEAELHSSLSSARQRMSRK